MSWTAVTGGLVGALVGAAVGGGVAVAATKKGRHVKPAAIAGVLGGALAGLGGAMLGKRSQYNAWTAANQLCTTPGQVADWATLQCVNGCPDDSIPVNGSCPGVQPSPKFLGM
jgi:hypothetical protein